jgi:hypothetical protein
LQGTKATKETREKVSSALRGRIVTQETREKISQAQRGKPRLHRKLTPEEYKNLGEKRRGIPRSISVKQKVSEALKGHTLSFETRQKISVSLTGKVQTQATKTLRANSIKKIVFQYTRDFLFIKEWASAVDVSRELKINPSHIRQCCKGYRKSAGGFVWTSVKIS